MAGLGHKITAVPLLILLPLAMLSSIASATRRSPAALSVEGFTVLRKVPTGPSNDTSPPRPPASSQVAESPVVDFPVLRKVPTGPSNDTSPPRPPASSQVAKSPVVDDLPVLRKVPRGPSNITSDPPPPPSSVATSTHLY
jgi:hypothetical protein